MKVVYNACFGGFGLSNLALDEYAKKKSIKLFWYLRSGYSPTIYTKQNSVPEGSSFSTQAFTVDLGDVTEDYPEGSFYYPNFDRIDPDLVAVVESLGDKANGDCASLEIKEIPDGAEYEITEYDGSESAEPPRMSW